MKLIRDNYIDIINEKEKLFFETEQREIKKLLSNKIIEEYQEILDSDKKDIYEYADLIEVLYATIKFKTSELILEEDYLFYNIVERNTDLIVKQPLDLLLKGYIESDFSLDKIFGLYICINNLAISQNIDFRDIEKKRLDKFNDKGGFSTFLVLKD